MKTYFVCTVWNYKCDYELGIRWVVFFALAIRRIIHKIIEFLFLSFTECGYT